MPIPSSGARLSTCRRSTSGTSPSFSSHPSSTGRTIPPAETLLLAVTPNQARTIEFLSQNESLSVVQTQNDLAAPPVNACIGTNQTTAAP